MTPDLNPRVASTGFTPGGAGPTAFRLPPGPGIDWTVVRRLRRDVAVRLGEEISRLSRTRGVELSGADVRMLGRQLVLDAVAEWVTTTGRDTGHVPDTHAEDALTAAVVAALFGLGRLQPLVDDPRVENIDVDGCDRVWVSYADGTAGPGPAIADSDTELIELVQTFAAYLSATAREFSSAHPLLTLRLPDGSRLAAWMSVTARPGLTIRRHRLSTATLEDLVAAGSMDAGLGEFLAAAVRARKNIVVTGGMNAGKTTLVRALAAEIDPGEKVVVIEKEYELGLDRLPGPARQVVSMEARDANSEGTGAVSLASLVVHALRMNARRIIVGEVRGDELIPMLTAMGSGNDGSLCTLHANSAHAAFNRIAAIGLACAERLPVEAAHLLAADALDFVVHVRLSDDTAGGTGMAGLGGHLRYVSQVLEVLDVGEAGRVTTNEVYAPGPDGRAHPAYGVRCLEDLIAAGFDPAHLDTAHHNPVSHNTTRHSTGHLESAPVPAGSAAWLRGVR